MQKRRIFLGQDFTGVVCACLALAAMAGVGSFAQSGSPAPREKDPVTIEEGRIERRKHPDHFSRIGGERPKPDLQEISRLKREIRENARTQAAVALPIKTLDDRRIVQAALREERARIREELKTHGSTQQQRIEEVRQEARRRIDEAKENAHHTRE